MENSDSLFDCCPCRIRVDYLYDCLYRWPDDTCSCGFSLWSCDSYRFEEEIKLNWPEVQIAWRPNSDLQETLQTHWNSLDDEKVTCLLLWSLHCLRISKTEFCDSYQIFESTQCTYPQKNHKRCKCHSKWWIYFEFHILSVGLCVNFPMYVNHFFPSHSWRV